ncbi:MAG: multicopper oxidase domain-containing protein, partial [Chloroflexi bacterium]|nr:multicopper oxidase domain-containing protein [Chloroflexota bacterium]
GVIADQVVYAFNGTGTTYTGLSATTGPAGEPAAFQLAYGDYLFRSDDVNGTQYWTSTVCDVPTCTAASLVMPVMGAVDVTVEDANGTIANQTVYAFDGTGTTYLNLSATTGAAGEPAAFILPAGDYLFRSDDVNGTQYFTATVCDVPTCTAVTLTMPVIEQVDVTVIDWANNPLPDQTVYAFDDTTYTGLSSITDGAGLASFNLPAGDYRFATDVYGIRHYSDTANHCTVPGCGSATLTVQATTLPANTCTSTGPTSRTCDLWATTGTISMPDGNSYPIWGYSDSATGPAQLPGPMLIVNEGETITINLVNDLTEDTALYFPGLEMVPDLTGAAANGGTTSYTFIATRPGTFQYEAGLLPNTQHQVPMGLFGGLIVRPSTPNQAYNDADSAFNDETLLILSELDPALNTSTDPSTFDMRYFSPKYWLINGKAYPETQEIPTATGNTLLLRYINAGSMYHTMSLLGLDQEKFAVDGNPYPYRRSVVADVVGAGETKDMIVDIPVSTPDGAMLALYDSSLLLHNNNDTGLGGMMTFITTAAGTPGADTTGPAITNMLVAPTPTDGTLDVALTATASDAATGGAAILAAEYYIDDTNGIPVAMTAADGTFDTTTENIEATILAATVDGLSPGDHTIYVRGQDALGNWGAFNIATLRIEQTGSGPTTKSLTLVHNATAGDVDVLLSGTADDSATGNSIITDARYTIDAMGPFTLTVNLPIPIASIDATIPAATLSTLAEGIHTVTVESRDEFLWGAAETIDLKIDHSGPNTTNVVVAPNPNNGTVPINPSLYAARLDATITDPLSGAVNSNIYRAEFFINDTCDDGTGIPMYARDGVFDSPTENAYALISLVNINALGSGTHDILVHGRDNSGNWGACTTTQLVIDQGLPTVTGTNAAPNPTAGAATVSLTAVATEVGATIDVAEWFVDADPGQGNGIPMTLAPNADWDLSATIDVSTWAIGTYTLYVRAHDVAGNWSTTDSVVLSVTDAAATYGVSMTPAADGSAGAADTIVTYILNITNDGNIIDTFDVVVSGNGWPTTAPATVGPLAAGATGQISVDVTIPATAVSGDSDVATVTVTSQGDAGQTAVSTLTTSVVTELLYFSTAGNTAVPGVGGTPDDANIYSWNGTTFNLVFDAVGAGLPANADIDAMKVIDADTIYMSFDVDGLSLIPGQDTVQDEDIVLYDAGTLSLFFDGSELGLNSNNGEDVDAFEILPDGSLLISAIGLFNTDPEFRRNLPDEDMVQCVPADSGPITSCDFNHYFDGSDVGFGDSNGEDINGVAVSNGNIYLTTVGGYSVPGLSGSSSDVIVCNGPTTGLATGCASLSMYFDGSVEGVSDQLDAIDLP